MSQVSEIKCPHCGKWNLWNGKADEKCTYCHGYLDPERFLNESEKKTTTAATKEDFYAIKDSDETIVQLYKMFVNSFRFGSYYTILLFFIIIAILLVIFGLLSL